MIPYSPIPNRTSSPQPSETANSTIQEMTKLYLDNYKRQLQDSKSELNSRMTLLDKEKEKVSRIRDIRKRELYMRRQAAIEAFRLERERELNVQINKIDELKNEINNEPDTFPVNLSISSYTNEDTLNQSRSRTQVAKPNLPSQNRERLASLRRNLVINSTNNFSTNATQSDFFGETSNPYYISYNNFEESFNTPRSARSTYSFADQQANTAPINQAAVINNNRTRSELNKENRNANDLYNARSLSSFTGGYDRKIDNRSIIGSYNNVTKQNKTSSPKYTTTPATPYKTSKNLL